MRTRHTMKVLALAASSRFHTTIKPPTVTLFFLVSYAAFTRHTYVRFALVSEVDWVAWKGSAALYYCKHVVFFFVF